jgi:hypothetical protein
MKPQNMQQMKHICVQLRALIGPTRNLHQELSPPFIHWSN